ncbi:type VI secretion system tube protein Hcp [Luteolibacter flavescens]|uniref:Type VI secretion system tube protein Hcp n=1 Tax=Luteolibacter flavescens TaxID=1859460 RepID=A0ABT3FKU2_9BACT|nr:type VI secretion system tube protein TssD [Luteolibacter flavescens]MCW1884188.1 type VI secretion system tube protein Hcp [Luteolibacter flavescens]
MKHLFTLLAGVCLLALSSVRAAESIHMTIDRGGTKIEGELEGGAIEVLGYQHEITTPRDPASGLPTGRRMHRPMSIVKAIDKATPMIHQLFARNSKCDEIILKFWRNDPKTGKKTQYYTISMKDCFIIEVRDWKPNARDLSADRAGDLQEVMFTYKEITWTYGEGGPTFTDSTAPSA